MPRRATEGEVGFPSYQAYKIDRVTVAGGDTIFVEGRPTLFERIHPGYCATYFPDGDAEVLGPAQAATLRVSDPLVSIHHWNARTYGHLLLEVLPKLAAFRMIREAHPAARLLVSTFGGEGLIGILRHFVPDEALLMFDHRSQRIEAETLILFDNPTEGAAIHPFTQRFVEWACALSPRGETLPRRLFISKARWRAGGSDYRCLANEAEIVAALADAGVVPVSPEEFAWPDQVALFAGAELVVGEFTSALHNAIFSPFGTRVVALNYVNEMQDAIAAFAGHRIGYVLPRDGRARVWSAEASDGEDAYEVDPDAVRALVPGAAG